MNLFFKMVIVWFSILIVGIFLEDFLKKHKERNDFWWNIWKFWKELPKIIGIILLLWLIYMFIAGAGGQLPDGFYLQDFWGRN